MSDTDSFIEEVTEEVRRDRLFKLLRRYGWIGVVAVLAIVGLAIFSEVQSARQTAAAEKLGDSLIGALAQDDAAARAAELSPIVGSTPEGDAVARMLQAAAQVEAGDTAGAVAALEKIAANGDVEPIYQQIAGFKALLLQSETLDAATRRIGFEALAAPGAALRPLAEEQLALIDIEEGNSDAAISRLKVLSQDSESDEALKQRAIQMIVALGGDPQV